MANIIDELIVLLKLDTKPFKKAADEQVRTVQGTTKKIQISEADAERIERSRETSRDKRQKDSVRKQKVADRERTKSAEEFGRTVKNVALGAVGAVLGFESLKGAITFLGNLNTATAALGRTSANLGVSAHDLQTWGLAVEQIGGDSKEAQASFGALSQQLTALKLRGEVGPLIQFFQNLGIYVRDAKGEVKDLTTLLGEIPGAAGKRGLSRRDAFNLANAAGVSEGVFNLLYAPNSKQLLDSASANTYANEGAINRSAEAQRKVTNFKQKVTKDIADFKDDAILDPLHTYLRAVAFPVVAPYKAAVAGTTDLFESLFGERGATVGVRNNNPGNLEDRSGRQRRFATAAQGAAALEQDIDTKITRDKLNTLRKIISKYAPAGDGNDVEAYLKDVSKRTGYGVDEPLSGKYLPAVRFAISDAIIHHEQGPKGYAQTARALATPNVGPTAGAAGDVNTVSIGQMTVNTQATDAQGVTTDFLGAMQRRGYLSQSNTGITP